MSSSIKPVRRWRTRIGLVDVISSSRASRGEDLFGQITPPKPPYNKNDEGWLGYTADEYQKRFGIDFKAGPVSFERIQELVLARNAGIHREDAGNLEAYGAKIKEPAFVDDGYVGEYFFVTRAALVAMIEDSERFVKWMVSEVEKLRLAKKV